MLWLRTVQASVDVVDTALRNSEVLTLVLTPAAHPTMKSSRASSFNVEARCYELYYGGLGVGGFGCSFPEPREP